MASEAYIASETWGPRVVSRNGGKSWRTFYYIDGTKYSAGTYAMEILAAKALSKAYHFFEIPDAGPGVLPPLDQEQINDLADISEDQLRASFKAASFIFSRGSSAYRGVSWRKDKDKWEVKHKGISLGHYDSEEEAARAYDRAALAKDRNAVTNFPAEQYPDLAIEAGGEDPAAGVGQGTAASGAVDGAAAGIGSGHTHSDPPGQQTLDDLASRRAGKQPMLAGGGYTTAGAHASSSSQPQLPAAEHSPLLQLSQGTPDAAEHAMARVEAAISAAWQQGLEVTADRIPGMTSFLLLTRMQGLNLADWEDDGAGLAAYEFVPGVNSPGSKPKPSKPEPGTIAWSLQFGSDTEDNEDMDEREPRYGLPGMTEADVEAYLAGGRLEPNLHMFTNELYPPFRTRLEAARFASFQAFLAAYSDGWQNPQLLANLEVAGNAHLAAVRAHESSSSEDDEPAGEEEEDAAAAGGSAPGRFRMRRSDVRMLDQILRPSKYWAPTSFAASGAAGPSAAAAGAAAHPADGVPSSSAGDAPVGERTQPPSATRPAPPASASPQPAGATGAGQAPASPDDADIINMKEWDAFLSEKRSKVQRMMEEFEERKGSLELNLACASEGRAENERLAADLARAKEDEALLRQDTAAQQAYTKALLAGDTNVAPPKRHFDLADLQAWSEAVSAGNPFAPFPARRQSTTPAVHAAHAAQEPAAAAGPAVGGPTGEPPSASSPKPIAPVGHPGVSRPYQMPGSPTWSEGDAIEL